MALYFRNFALVASLALSSTACIVQWGDGQGQGGGTSIDDGFVDGGGAGGSDLGTGGSDPATGGDDGVGGDDAGACTIQDQDPYAWELCDALPGAPSNMGECDDGLASIAYEACLKGYEILNPRDGNYLHGCLMEIAATDACTVDPVAECVDDTYATSCLSVDVPAMCQTWGDACEGGGDTFDVPRCAEDLNAMNQQAIDELAACIADSPETTCQDRYETCFDQLVAME